MIESDRILKKVYKDAEAEIASWGVAVILNELGFNMDTYTNKVRLNDNNHMINVIFKDDDIKQITEKLSRRINYNLKHHLLDILENDILPNVISTTQDILTKQASLYVEQQIYQRIFKSYRTKLEDRLTEEVMSDPKIQEIMLGKL